MAFLQWTVLGNTVQTWACALLITIPILVLFWAAQRVLLRRFRRHALATKSAVDDVISGVLARTRFWLLAVLAVYAGSLVLTLPPEVAAWSGALALAGLLAQLAIWADALIDHWLACYQKQHGGGEGVGTMRVVGFFARLALYSLVALLALDNLPNVQVTSLIASLGVGGIAVALAVQNILADLLASLSIAFDRPFVIGDAIVVGDYSGTVEQIGLKTTRLRSLSGEQLIISNNDLLSSRIRNYRRMQERRIAFTIGVTYETPYDKLERIPALIREIIEAQPLARFDRAHFQAYGDLALLFETVYYMRTPDYAAYMDTQQAINLAIFRRFAEEGIAFARPAQMLYVSKN
ncbi:MAG TPA: mechanosensitive ion channel family protein [Anaerolineae bacterium]|nr:mechanosensitive ion channel family protein [Anaerolineae bacterium]HPL29515.1 mechanosensitive ion channel family protein [Anaerolineae bacterium]